MRTSFILVLIGLFLLLSIKSRIAALYTYWWFGVFRPQDWIFSDISSLHLPLIAAILFIFPSFFIGPKITFKHPLAKLMLLLVILLFIANQLNGCSNPVFVRTSTPLEALIRLYVSLLTAAMLTDKKKIFGLFLVLVLSLGFHAAKGGFHALISGTSLYGLNVLGGFLSGSNAYALATGMIIFMDIFCIQYLYGEIKKAKEFSGTVRFTQSMMQKGLLLLCLLIAFGSFYNVIALESRGSFLATSGALVLWTALQPYRMKVFFIFTIGLLLILTFVHLPEGFTDRIQSAFVAQEDLDSSAASRPYFWAIARKIAANHPMGVGPGCYPEYFNNYSDGKYGYYRSVHSSHFQILSDAGYLGLTVWVGMILLTLGKLWSFRKRLLIPVKQGSGQAKFYLDLSNALFCSALVFFIGGSFYELAYNDFIWLIFALITILDEKTKKAADTFGITGLSPSVDYHS